MCIFLNRFLRRHFSSNFCLPFYEYFSSSPSCSLMPLLNTLRVYWLLSVSLLFSRYLFLPLNSCPFFAASIHCPASVSSVTSGWHSWFHLSQLERVVYGGESLELAPMSKGIIWHLPCACFRSCPSDGRAGGHVSTTCWVDSWEELVTPRTTTGHKCDCKEQVLF